jgi:DNA polymerase-3 subunit beta
MKMTTTAAQLADLLGRVARAAATRPTTPILGGVLFRARAGENGAPGSLSMAATDTEMSLTLNASAPVEEAGTAVVPATVLLRYARSLPKRADVTLHASDEEGTATLSSGKSSVTLRCYPAEDFPAPAAFPEEGAFSVPTRALASSVGRVLPFASSDKSRPVLTGVLVEFEEAPGPVARLVATDSYRLGVDQADLRGAKGVRAARAIVPARALKEAARLASLGTEIMDVSLTQNSCAFGVGGGALVLTARLIEGNYPEYRRLLPDGFAHAFGASREDLSAALSRVGLLAAGTPPTPVTLAFSREQGALGEGELRISLRNNDRGGAAAEVVPARVPEGTDFSACFNPNYLADAVASLEADDLEFCFNGPLKPAILRAAAASSEEGKKTADGDAPSARPDGRLRMIMPMPPKRRYGRPASTDPLERSAGPWPPPTPNAASSSSPDRRAGGGPNARSG